MKNGNRETNLRERAIDTVIAETNLGGRTVAFGNWNYPPTAAWLSDITKTQGGMAPVGNTESSWLVLPNELEEASNNGSAHSIEHSKFQALTQEMADSGDSNAALFAAMAAAAGSS